MNYRHLISPVSSLLGLKPLLSDFDFELQELTYSLLMLGKVG